MKNKIIIFTLILLALFSIAGVCAGDVNDTLTASENDSQLELNDAGDNLKSIDENQVTGDKFVEDNGSFVALQERIDKAGDNSTVALPNDYLLENGFKETGILINKSLTIDGNGFTINANGNARIFNIAGAAVTLQNIKFINGQIDGMGAAVYCKDSNLAIINCTFSNNHAIGNNSQGGAVYFNGDKFTIFNSEFIANSADYDGGAVYFKGDDGLINASKFTNNKAYYNGAVYLNSVNGTVDNCIFANNVATNSSGALGWVKQQNGTIINSQFINNTAPFGGAIYVNEGNNFSVSSSKFIKNNASIGGAIYWTGGDGIIFNSTFDGNSASKDGGAVYLEGSEGIIDRSNFTNNKAKRYGALYMDSIAGIMDKCIFANNVATDSAGAIGWVKKENGTIRGSRFINNSAPLAGAIYVNNGTEFYISISHFINNTASVDGGAIYWESGNEGIITLTSFINNNAAGNGGAVYFNGTNANIGYSRFTNNTAASGGAIYNTGSMFAIGNSFNNNTAADGKNDIAGIGSTKLGVSFEIGAEDTVYGKTAKIIVNVTSNYKPINGGIVSTVVNNVTYNASVVNGVATLQIPNLDVGSYEMNITYAANDSNYRDDDDFYILDIEKQNVTLKIDVEDNVYGKTAKINVAVDGDGQPVNRGSVSTVVNNVTYNASVVNGVATLQIPNLKVGSYKMVISYNDSNYNNCTESYTLVINKQNVKITVKVASFIINYGGKYSITLKDSKGNAVAGEKVTFTLGGKAVGSAVTNARGLATVSLTAKVLKSVKAGKKNMVVKLTSKNYNAAAKTVKITIKKEKTKITAKNKKFKKSIKTKKYIITLKNSKGKAVKKVKVTLKVKGKTYTAKTNSKGKATFKIKKLTKKGKHTATIKFKGNAYYLKISKKVKITVR